jgi:hypothetical protein
MIFVEDFQELLRVFRPLTMLGQQTPSAVAELPRTSDSRLGRNGREEMNTVRSRIGIQELAKCRHRKTAKSCMNPTLRTSEPRELQHLTRDSTAPEGDSQLANGTVEDTLSAAAS